MEKYNMLEGMERAMRSDEYVLHRRTYTLDNKDAEARAKRLKDDKEKSDKKKGEHRRDIVQQPNAKGAKDPKDGNDETDKPKVHTNTYKHTNTRTYKHITSI
jgi:hypothetical protein